MHHRASWHISHEFCRRRSALATKGFVLILVTFLWNAKRQAFIPPANKILKTQAPADTSRRQALAASLLCVAGPSLLAACTFPQKGDAMPIWRPLPADVAEPCLYPTRFTTYLTRFLLNFDADFQALYKKAQIEEGMQEKGFLSQVVSEEFMRDELFGRFARTAELSLNRFIPVEGGSGRLLQQLLNEYGESFEARRQLCILFSLLQDEGQQPVVQLRKLLRNVENASVATVEVRDCGELYINATDGSIPRMFVRLTEPPGEGRRHAQLICDLKPLDINQTRWSVVSVRVEQPGRGYASDMELSPQVSAPFNFEIAKMPRFVVTLTRPGKIPAEQRKLLPAELKRKRTALLPPSLLPTYNGKRRLLLPDQSVPVFPNPSQIEESRRLDEVFAEGRQLDRFRADFVFADFDPSYGAVGVSPLERERQPQASDYLRLAISGAVAGLVRTVVFLPVLNIKVRMQTDESLGGAGLANAFKVVAQREPVTTFFRGIDVASLAAVAFGILSFGVKEYVQRELVSTYPAFNSLLAIVVATAIAVLASLLVATPLEVITAQVMAAKQDESVDGPPYWGISVLLAQLQSKGLDAIRELYQEYWLLVGKELAFEVTKFVIFDSLREGLLFLIPAFAEAQSLLVACACGALAGAAAAIVSHPIDTLFARRATSNGSDEEFPSLEELFRGVGARVLFLSVGIALTFLTYDVVKTSLGVGGNAFQQTLDLLRNPS